MRSSLHLRDPQKESVWLELAELDAGQSGFAERVAERLSAGEEAYGDRWAAAGVGNLLGELSEEAADLGAWGVLALQALEHHGRRARQRDQVAARLRAAILWGAYAHFELALAADQLRGCQARRRAT